MNQNSEGTVTAHQLHGIPCGAHALHILLRNMNSISQQLFNTASDSAMHPCDHPQYRLQSLHWHHRPPTPIQSTLTAHMQSHSDCPASDDSPDEA